MEAFSTLASTLSALELHLGPTSLGLVLVPVIILGLVSRANSEERELCMWYISKFLEPMANPSFGPTSGETLSFDIPWEKLDEYNEAIENHRGAEATMAQIINLVHDMILRRDVGELHRWSRSCY